MGKLKSIQRLIWIESAKWGEGVVRHEYKIHNMHPKPKVLRSGMLKSDIPFDFKRRGI